MVALAPEAGWRAVGTTVDDIGDMADQRGVEDLVDGLAVITAALVHALHLVDRCDPEGLGCVARALRVATFRVDRRIHNNWLPQSDCGADHAGNMVHTKEPVP